MISTTVVFVLKVLREQNAQFHKSKYISDILRMNMHVVYVQVNDKGRMYLNVLIMVGIKEGFISILLTPER